MDDRVERMLLQYDIEQFYYEEAAILDERRFTEWLSLLASDIHYWMPIRRTVMAENTENEFTKMGAMAFFDDDKAFLEARVKKIGSGYSWSEDPPSRTRHHVTNIRLIELEGDEMTVESNFHLFRTRLESDQDFWMGRRRDVLRRIEGSLKIAKRYIFLDHTVLQSRNMSNFF
jgi:biphenyl 2,3-dioxygenase beta subunit